MKPSKQSGSTLIGVIVGVLTVSFAIVLILKSRTASEKSLARLTNITSYKDLKKAFAVTIMERVDERLRAGPCLYYPQDLNQVPIYGPISFSYYRPTPSKDTDQSRCANPYPRNATPSSSERRMYFCVKLNTDSGADPRSLAGAKKARAEVNIEFINLQTMQPMSCGQYRSARRNPESASVGIGMTATLYWETVESSHKHTMQLISNLAE